MKKSKTSTTPKYKVGETVYCKITKRLNVITAIEDNRYFYTFNHPNWDHPIENDNTFNDFEECVRKLTKLEKVLK